MFWRAVWPLACAVSFVALPGMVEVAPAQVGRAWMVLFDDGKIDAPTAIAADRDGSVVVTGLSQNSATECDLATVKYSSDGTQLWARLCSGEMPGGLVIDSAGNVLVTGAAAGDPDRQLDYVTAKYSPDGTELWVRRYDGPGHLNDVPEGIAVDAAGNALVTGKSDKAAGTDAVEFATVKYDPDGREVWVRRYTLPGNESGQPCGLAVDGSGNVYVAGSSLGSAATGLDCLTVKYAPDGTELWARRFNGPDSLDDDPMAIAADAAGDVYLTGGSLSSGGDWDFATVKYAPDGTELWVRRWNGPASGVDMAAGIAVGARGDVHVTGGSRGADGRSGWVTIKYDRDGHELWVERHGGQDFFSPPAAIVLDGAGNVLIAGDLPQFGSNHIVKYHPDGKVLWVKEQPVSIAAIAVDQEGGVYATGQVGNHFATVKYEPPPLRRGAIDADESVGITDAIAVLNYLFVDGVEPTCLDAADIDDNGDINISDPIVLLRHLFLGGPAPAEPFLECGRDTTADSLECGASEICSPFRGLPSMVFYGQEFQADGVFYVVDHSSGMGGTGEVAIARREILRAIGGFPATVEFGIVFFDTSVYRFPPSGAPAKADAATKADAASFVQSVQGGSGSCCQEGLLAGLECASQAKARRKVLIHVGNGGGTCNGADEATYLQQTLTRVTASNTEAVEIHCIGVLNPSPLGTDFMQRLAWDNGGTYTEIVR